MKETSVLTDPASHIIILKIEGKTSLISLATFVIKLMITIDKVSFGWLTSWGRITAEYPERSKKMMLMIALKNPITCFWSSLKQISNLNLYVLRVRSTSKVKWIHKCQTKCYQPMGIPTPAVNRISASVTWTCKRDVQWY